MGRNGGRRVCSRATKGMEGKAWQWPPRLSRGERHGIHLPETALPEDGKADQDEIRVNPWVLLGEASV